MRIGCKPETESKYRSALSLYSTTSLSIAGICRMSGVSVKGFTSYIHKWHRELMLSRNGIKCGPEESVRIKIRVRGGQRPATRAKYKDAISACTSMSYMEYSISEIAREYGLSGPNLARQLRTHYPEVQESRERTRRSLGLADNLHRGARPDIKAKYAGALSLLRSDRYITVREASSRCGVSYSGLEQHLIFYHKDLVEKRIKIRGQASGNHRRGGLTGVGRRHVPSPELTCKYSESLGLYLTTPMSARRVALNTGVSVKGFYKYLQTWHKESVCRKKGIPYEEGKSVDWSSVRRYSPSAASKYAEAIVMLKTGSHRMSEVAKAYGLHPDSLRQYLKTHEPELYGRLGMRTSENGRKVSYRSMEKYKEAIRLYETTSESLKSIARRLALNDSSLRQFIKRNRPGLPEHRKPRK